ncbi:MAG TPA: PaaI family thioesterase [Oscillospiraceae bacterium]|nr:PaaI family thioesterase [Oscillospiraceae bacterium]HPS35636.1 PaaI family thioesterase [Oscillospiraceae bacterium]
MDLTEKAKEFFKADIYAVETTGIEILEVKPNYAKCRLYISPKHLNAANTVMGGAIFTLADLTFAVAANSCGIMTQSLTSQIAFLSVAKGQILFAEATCVKGGKSTCYFIVDVTDELGTKVASVSATGFRKACKAM